MAFQTTFFKKPLIGLLLVLLVFFGTRWLGNVHSFAEEQTPPASASFITTASTLHFAHLSDVHYDANGIDTSRRLLKDSPVLLTDALKTLNAKQDVQLLLFTGDSVNTPRLPNFQGFFKTLHQHNTLPVRMVLGNHDVGVKPHKTRQYTIDAFRQLGGEAMFPSKQTGWYSSQLTPWLTLLVLDGTTDEKVSANGFIPQAELTWLKQQLAQAQEHNHMVILASHFPLVEPFSSKSHKIMDADAAKLLHVIEASPNVVAYFAGHYHSTKIKQRNGIYYVTTPALVEYPNAYRTVTINASGEMNLYWHPSNRSDLIAKSRKRSKYAQAANGNPAKDHEATALPLRYVPPQK